MRITPICNQKGLRTYVVSKAGNNSRVRYKATLSSNGSSMNVPVIKAGNGDNFVVVVLPAHCTTSDSRIEIIERHTGKAVNNIDIAHAEFMTKISRRTPDRFSPLDLIDKIDSQNPLCRGQYDINLNDCFDAFDGDVVWRIAIDWHGSMRSKPRLELVDSNLEKIEASIHEFELQENLFREDHIVNRLIATFRIPKALADFCLFARDPQREITPNFYPMDSLAASSILMERANGMKSVDDQQDAYASWIKSHFGSLKNSESGENSASKGSLHIILLDKGGSNDEVVRSLESLEMQRFENWTATVIGQADSDVVFSDGRIESSCISSAAEFPSALRKIAQEAPAERICMIAAGDVFAPGAFSAIAKASSDPMEVIIFDEDTVDDKGVHMLPRFKGPLNKQLEYTENWIGYGAFFPTELVANAVPHNATSPSLAAYSVALKAIEWRLPFASVPHVLLSTPTKTPDKQANPANTFSPSEVDAAKKILSTHLHAIGAYSAVEDGFLDGTLRISLASDYDPGKVSIVIPTIDHSDMLERCVSSLLNVATYKSLEIILVENNSREDETFALYDRLQHENPGIVKVIKWQGGFNYSAIVNFGAAASTGKFLLLLNNDTEVIVPGFIEEMLALATIPEVGVVGAKLYFKDMLVQHAGMLIGPYGGISHANQNFSDIRPGYQNRALTQCSFSSVTSACQMMRREVFEEVGGYDETFMVGFNDADFCLKVRAAGYDVVFTPYAELYHYEFVSRGREAVDDEKQARWESERDAFFAKWREELKGGDPLTSPNLDKDNWYYALPSK